MSSSTLERALLTLPCSLVATCCRHLCVRRAPGLWRAVRARRRLQLWHAVSAKGACCSAAAGDRVRGLGGSPTPRAVWPPCRQPPHAYLHTLVCQAALATLPTQCRCKPPSGARPRLASWQAGSAQRKKPAARACPLPMQPLFPCAFSSSLSHSSLPALSPPLNLYSYSACSSLTPVPSPSGLPCPFEGTGFYPSPLSALLTNACVSSRLD